MGTEKPQIGNWHRWGEDDERGALNLINPQAIVRAAGLVKLGAVYNIHRNNRRPLVQERRLPLYKQAIVKLIAQGKKNGSIRSDVDPTVLVDGIFSRPRS